jgi:hypothetical protein
VTAALTVYVVGVALGCWLGDAPAPRRVGLALIWLVALLACVVTLSVLLVAAAVFFPVVGIALVAAGAAGWWTFAG